MNVSPERLAWSEDLGDELGDRPLSLATIAREVELPLFLVGVIAGLLYVVLGVCIAWRWVANKVRRPRLPLRVVREDA